MNALVAEVAEKGNAHRGEAIYRRKELNCLKCLKCHAIGGAGGRVGPDMLSLGSSAQIDDIAPVTWSPAYSTVGGELPLTDLPEFRIPFRAKEGQLGAAFTRFEVDVTSTGQAKLLLNSTDGLTAWLDANPIKLEKETQFDLPMGRHRITFAIELSQRKEPLKVELAEVPGSSAKVQLVSGK